MEPLREHSTVDANGVPLHVAVDGPERAPWVTMLHGLATNMTLFDPQVAVLAPAWRILRIDARGHGRSSVPPGPYDFAMLKGDVVAVWDQLGISRSHVLGVSMGGMTGFGLALAHPDRVDRLIAADCRADAPDSFKQMWDRRRQGAMAAGMAGVVDDSLEAWLTETTRETNLDLVESARQMILATPVEGYIAATAALRELSYKHRLRSITRPSLLIVGRQDGPHPQEMETMASLIPDARFTVIEGAGHLANLERPQVFNQLVGTFLETPPRGPSTIGR